MASPVIIERISAAIGAGELKQVPNSAIFRPVSVISDLLRDWSEMFPGVELNEEGSDTRDLFAWGRLRQPKLTPKPRQSRRRLRPPRPIAASPCTISPGLFASVKGIWDYYRTKGVDDDKLLQEPFEENGMQRFIQPLWDEVSNYYPLFVLLEVLFDDCNLRDIASINLLLPHYTYDCDEAGAVEAFLSGAEGLTWLMTHYHKDNNLGLPPKDEALIKEVGFGPLSVTYVTYPGEKSCDMLKLENISESFFAGVAERFPARWAEEWPIISANGGVDNELHITCREDIEFCIAYADAWEEMMGSMPDPYQMETNDGGICGDFIHEMCEVYRKVRGKKPVKWKSPVKTLAEIYGEGKAA
jgi:hypothetical protein